MTSKRVGKAFPQLGEYDPDILCETCDNLLGKNDEYAIEICRSFETHHVLVGNDIFEMRAVDCDRFSKFVLSVLWRASISSRQSFTPVKLGPYESLVRDILFEAKNLSHTSASSGRALQEGFVNLSDAVLHQCIRPLIGACGAPGHHGYQRACDLITGQASNGPFGSPVFACAGKTDPPSSSHPLADLGG
jgi:hypothetical protein